MHVTPHGASSYPPDLDDDQIGRQLAYALARRWAIAIEHADDPNPSNLHWETWGAPALELRDVASALDEVNACRAAHPDRYVHVVAFDTTQGDTVRLAFLVQRPEVEPRFELRREVCGEQRVRYTLARRPREAARESAT